MEALTARAPAKVNLTLHVLGRRPDGYHALESLVAFAGTGDTLSLEPGGRLSLAVAGPMAAQAVDLGGKRTRGLEHEVVCNRSGCGGTRPAHGKPKRQAGDDAQAVTHARKNH